MFTKIPSQQIFLGNYSGHTGRFHFSFADYKDPENVEFGDLIAFNDFCVRPNSGFDTHPHEELEIISYCLEGQLDHEDNMGNKCTLERGDMQYTCAGSGITHSEKNNSSDRDLRFVQIWIKPNAEMLTPYYRSIHFDRRDRLNRLLHIASGQPIKNVTRINQDANVYVSEVQSNVQLGIRQLPNRQVYLACLEGSFMINGVPLSSGDAIKTWGERSLSLLAMKDCHLVIIEMSRCS
jgi:redox-sensitive bicupin YhaK (pirin superfamily)